MHRLRTIALILWCSLALGSGCDSGPVEPCERSTPMPDGCGFRWECGPEGRVTVRCTQDEEGAPATCTCSVSGGRVDSADTVQVFESAGLCGVGGQDDESEATRIAIVEAGCGYSLRSQLRASLGDAGPRPDAGQSP